MIHSTSTIRQTVLQVMSEFADRPNFHQTGVILSEAAKRLNLRGDAEEQELLTIWDDLFRMGIIGTGLNLGNPNPPFCHITDRGRQTLKDISRDPANPEGYLAALKSVGHLSLIAESYIVEALHTYNSACFKAAAVMVGCASEAVLLDLRDAVVSRLGAHGRIPSPKLSDWRAKTVLDAAAAELSVHVGAMPLNLRESFQYTWPAFNQQIRVGRNDSGHPNSIDPVTADAVHASLLIFPEVLTLTTKLIAWISSSMP